MFIGLKIFIHGSQSSRIFFKSVLSHWRLKLLLSSWQKLFWVFNRWSAILSNVFLCPRWKLQIVYFWIWGLTHCYCVIWFLIFVSFYTLINLKFKCFLFFDVFNLIVFKSFINSNGWHICKSHICLNCSSNAVSNLL